jgi:sporulation protein YlmC with PRC-barrel domain
MAAVGYPATRATEVIGKDVYDTSGENIGTVIDLIFEAEDGGQTLAVIALGGALTTSDVSHELPFSALEYSGDAKGYTVPFSKVQIADGSTGLAAKPRQLGGN